jgi:hypothetical protein
MDVDVLYVRLLKKGLSPYEATAQALAWASLKPKPERPERVPGMPGVNQQRMRDYADQVVAWAYGRAIRLRHGLVEP